jgi:lipoprotein-anchoring transpeptidase ErfK/SrfK
MRCAAIAAAAILASILGQTGGAQGGIAFDVDRARLAREQASHEIVVRIDKSAQRMAVFVDGDQKYSWLVSTGTGGGPRAGEYRPQRLERKWFSRKYGWSPMPHSIFFHEGYAIHGTIYVSRLGARASHGCVRLHPDNAAMLFSLVQGRGTANTRIVVEN